MHGAGTERSANWKSSSGGTAIAFRLTRILAVRQGVIAEPFAFVLC
jgi:hypothetical protein